MGPCSCVMGLSDVWHSSGILCSLKRNLDAFEVYTNSIPVQFCCFGRFREKSLPLKSFKTELSGVYFLFLCPSSPDTLLIGKEARGIIHQTLLTLTASTVKFSLLWGFMISVGKGWIKKGTERSDSVGKLSCSPIHHFLASSHFTVNFYVYVWHLSEVLLITMEAQVMLINESSSQKNGASTSLPLSRALEELVLGVVLAEQKLRS